MCAGVGGVQDGGPRRWAGRGLLRGALAQVPAAPLEELAPAEEEYSE